MRHRVVPASPPVAAPLLESRSRNRSRCADPEWLARSSPWAPPSPPVTPVRGRIMLAEQTAINPSSKLGQRRQPHRAFRLKIDLEKSQDGGGMLTPPSAPTLWRQATGCTHPPTLPAPAAPQPRSQVKDVIPGSAKVVHIEGEDIATHITLIAAASLASCTANRIRIAARHEAFPLLVRSVERLVENGTSHRSEDVPRHLLR